MTLEEWARLPAEGDVEVWSEEQVREYLAAHPEEIWDDLPQPCIDLWWQHGGRFPWDPKPPSRLP